MVELLCMKKYPLAGYYHFASHQLNLTIFQSNNVKEGQAILARVAAVNMFFKNSPKRQRQLEAKVEAYNNQEDQKENRLSKKNGKPCVKLGGLNDTPVSKTSNICFPLSYNACPQ